MRIILYLLSIVAANLVTASLAPLHILGFIVPVGTFLIGASFVLRDFTQMKYGRKAAYIAIGVALVLSAVTSLALKDTMMVVIASALSFIVSETINTEVFTAMYQKSYAKRIIISGVIGGLLDSGIFVLVGLSPLFGSNMLPWAFVANAIIGQFIFKALMQFLGAAAVKVLRRG
jgi:uncharacterized PurR-regulated membrane protein YhhQ (DUF165 family)